MWQVCLQKSNGSSLHIDVLDAFISIRFQANEVTESLTNCYLIMFVDNIIIEGICKGVQAII